MSFEINVISVAQERPVVYHCDSQVLLHNEATCEDISRYYRIWPVFSNVRGVFYSIVAEMDPGFYSAFPLCDSDFMNKASNDIPSYIPDAVLENLTPLIIKDEFIADVESIIDLLISSSPAKTILFQSRYQDGDFEVIQGTLRKKEFFQRLRQQRIMFNVCYAVTEDI